LYAPLRALGTVSGPGLVFPSFMLSIQFEGWEDGSAEILSLIFHIFEPFLPLDIEKRNRHASCYTQDEDVRVGKTLLRELNSLEIKKQTL